MTNNKSDSPDDAMDIYDCISASMSLDTLRRHNPNVFVFPSQNLRDAIRLILNNNTNQRNNETLTEHHEQIFEIIEQLHECPQKMFMYLRKHFAKQFDIDLYIITFDNGNFSLIKENHYDKKNVAVLLFNKDNTVQGPLYTISKNGTNETVFSVDNIDIGLDVYLYVAHLNDRKLPNDFPHIQEQNAVGCVQESIENSLIDNHSVSTNHLNSSYSVQVDDKIQSRTIIGNMSQQICRLFDNLPISSNTINQAFEPFLSYVANFDHLSPEETILALKDVNNCLSQLIQIVEPSICINQNGPVNSPQLTSPSQIHNPNMDMQNEINQTLSDADIPLETSLPNNVSTTATDINSSTIEQPMKYISPSISKPVKSTIHPRTLKEFASTRSSPVQCDDSKQREPLHITVPPDDENALYLGMKIVTIDNEIHPSKILVPDKTRANDEFLINNNDLRCLNCDACHPDDKLDLDNKHIYSKISSTERQASKKDIRIHMLNLYQRIQINRKMVQDQHLKKCKLALWFCINENGNFKPVSPVFHSNIIEESMKVPNTKKKVVNKK